MGHLSVNLNLSKMKMPIGANRRTEQDEIRWALRRVEEAIGAGRLQGAVVDRARTIVGSFCWTPVHEL
jgi:hypothetical protein